tara:strand:- start:329 stop:430 length:102 start_codon:yes stop_codon:yes gene_type:complete
MGFIPLYGAMEAMIASLRAASSPEVPGTVAPPT